MKKIKTVLSLILMLSLATSLLIEPAFALSPSEGNTPIILTDDEMAALDLSEFTLVGSTTIITFFDENGNVVDVIEGDAPSTHSTTTYTGDHDVSVIRFYKSGSTYYVSITVTAKPSDWWVEKVKLSVLPTGKDWIEREDGPESHKNPYHMPVLSWSYPEGSPANVTVDVKFYVHTRGEGMLDHYYGWSGKFTMENP